MKSKREYFYQKKTNSLHDRRKMNEAKKSNEPKFIPLNTLNAKHFPCACTFFAGFLSFYLYLLVLVESGATRSRVNKETKKKYGRMRKTYERPGTIVPISITSASFSNSHSRIILIVTSSVCVFVCVPAKVIVVHTKIT